MKKLFTLVALLAMVLGANSKTVVDTEFSYSDVSDWKEKGGWASGDAESRVSIDEGTGCLYFHSEEATANFYDVQFQAFGVKNLNPDAEYTIEFRIKGSVAQNIRAFFSGSDAPGEFALTTDWQTLTFKCHDNPSAQYFASSGMVLFQCGDYVGDWWISNVKITHEEEDGLVEDWEELLTNGNAEKAWADPTVKFDDQDKNFTICAWGKVKNENKNEKGGWDPFPATIEEEKGNTSNHVFVVHAADADSDEGWAWDNQFWIEGPKAMKAGRKYRVSFRYKASQEIKCQTQIHYQNPSSFKTGTGLGDISFTEDWQTYENEFIANNEHADGWSFAFNLNSDKQNATDFYFDDLSWQEVKLQEGFFVAICDAGSPDYNGVVPFKQEGDDYTITVGTEDAPVSEIMISTVYGTPSAFKGGAIKTDNLDFVGTDNFVTYKEANAGTIKLPGKGVWEIVIMGDLRQINIKLVSGKMYPKIEPNPTNIVVKGQERDDLADGVKQDGTPDIKEEEGGTGQTWDNQFFIIANRTLKAGESTVLKFKYKASTEAKTTTQCHERPGNYIHYSAIGDVNFTTDWQEFNKTFVVPNECNGEAAGKNEETGEVTFYKNFQSIAFNMAEIREACDYEIKDVVWMLEDGSESLIDQTGAKNFNVKEGAGTTPYIFGTDHETAISNVVVAKKNNSTVKFNLAGQRVSNDYKGIVVDGNGSKYLAK